MTDASLFFDETLPDDFGRLLPLLFSLASAFSSSALRFLFAYAADAVRGPGEAGCVKAWGWLTAIKPGLMEDELAPKAKFVCSCSIVLPFVCSIESVGVVPWGDELC